MKVRVTTISQDCFEYYIEKKRHKSGMQNVKYLRKYTLSEDIILRPTF